MTVNFLEIGNITLKIKNQSMVQLNGLWSAHYTGNTWVLIL